MISKPSVEVRNEAARDVLGLVAAGLVRDEGARNALLNRWFGGGDVRDEELAAHPSALVLGALSFATIALLERYDGDRSTALAFVRGMAAIISHDGGLFPPEG